MDVAQTLHGKTVAITGGARGIGLATAERLIGAGARVVIGDLDEDLARAEAERIGGLGFALDVTDDGSFTEFLATVYANLGRLDVLINNAGIMPTGPFLAQSPELAQTMFEVNVLGMMRGVRVALPPMLVRGTGHIINIASVAGRQVAAGMASYCATKHAVVGFTRALQREYRDSGVRFTLVMPSFTRTRMTEGAESKRIPASDPGEIAEGIADLVARPRDEVILPRSAAALVHTFEMMPRVVGDTVARRLGADEQFIAADGTARQPQWRSRAQL